MVNGGFMRNSLLIFFLFAFMFIGVNAKLLSSDTTYIAERGRGGDMNREDFNRSDVNRGDLNHNESFDRGAAYGADRGAAYGAAAGAAAAGSEGVPVNPNAAEQNMLYYGGVQSMEQGQ